MKRYLSYIFSFIFLCAGTGCTKYLDIKPKGVDVVSTIDQYNGLFNNITLLSYGITYVSAGSISPGGHANLTVTLSDEAVYSTEFVSYLSSDYLNAYRWLPDVYLATEESPEWDGLYAHIYTYNVIANGVMSAPDGTPEVKKQYLAEARANRAFRHFMLVNYFGKPYNVSTAATDPGVPIVTVAQAAASSGPRASVKDVYDFVVSELQASIPDLPENTVNRLRMGRAAATCMLGEVYFFMGKYDSALIQLNNTETLLQSATLPTALYDYNVVLPTWTPPFPNFPPNIPLPVNNTEVIYPQNVTLGFQGAIFLDTAHASLYDPADLRLQLFTKTDFSGSVQYPLLSRSAPYLINYGPSMPNLYLMLAECKARLNDLSGATADLTTLRTNRMPADVAAVPALSQDDLIRFIVDERYREFANTGFNWFDVRRLWNDPLFAGKTYTHTDAAGTYTLTADRLTLKIPPKIININPDMQNNP